MLYIDAKNDPRKMPSHLFWGTLHLDYTTAVRADISRQSYSVCPRYWYIDAAFMCRRCANTFVFTADEQKLWYEELGFWIDSRATNCAKCRRALRELKQLRQEYDRDVSAALTRGANLASKQRLIDVLDTLNQSGVKLPDKVLEQRRVLIAQIESPQSSGVE